MGLATPLTVFFSDQKNKLRFLWGRCCRAVGLGRRLAKPPSPRICEIGFDMEETAMPAHINLITTIELIICG